MAENKVDTSLFDTNYIMAMVVLSKLMRWRNHKTRVLDLHEKNNNNNFIYINRLNVLIFTDCLMQELRTVVTNLKSLRHSQIEFKKKIK